MNHALDNLASDLQKTLRAGRAMLPPQETAKVTVGTLPLHKPPVYDPSAMLEKLNAEQVEYNRRVKDVNFGEIR